MEKWEALQILELDENATKKQTEEKFSNLHRRIKNGEDLNTDSINDAYDFLMERKKYERNDNKFMAFYRGFMFHYKGWVVLSLLLLLVLVMVFVPMFFRSFPDLTVSFAGRYGFVDDRVMDDMLQEGLPDIEDIMVEVMYLDEKGESGEFDMGGRTRLTALLIAEDADILIVDDSTFNFIREDNSLMALNDLITEFSFEIPVERYIYGIDFDTGEKRIYGISVEDNNLVYKSIYGTSRRILTVAKKTGHIEEVKRAIELILTYRSDDDE